jgi:glycine betaine transporter
VLTGATAIALLLAGGLTALQQTVIVTSAPFLLIIIGLAVAFCRELRDDPLAQLGDVTTAAVVSQRPTASAAVDGEGHLATADGPWTDRVRVGADSH